MEGTKSRYLWLYRKERATRSVFAGIADAIQGTYTETGHVTLMTVHGAKGREFDFVYVIGLAEDVMPSFQSRQKGDRSPEMEEERRNCFVAITRTKECLVLSRAESYRGWRKAPSRFLVEMGLVRRKRRELNSIPALRPWQSLSTSCIFDAAKCTFRYTYLSYIKVS